VGSETQTSVTDRREAGNAYGFFLPIITVDVIKINDEESIEKQK
jgi:hypothetical protein